MLYGFALNVKDGELISPALWSGWDILKIATLWPSFNASTVSPLVNIPFTIDISNNFGIKLIPLV